MAKPVNERSKCAWQIREALPNELKLIYSTWLNSFHSDSFFTRICRNSVFYEEYAKIIDSILSKDSTKILVAYFDEFPTVVLSYLVYAPGLVHYLFTKAVYQRQGIARSLMEAAFKEEIKANQTIQCTHRTGKSGLILRAKEFPIEYNPFKLYNQELSGGDDDRQRQTQKPES